MKFTKSTGAKVQEDAVLFSMEISGVTRQFEISGDVLRRRFGAADERATELLRAFEDGEGDIKEAAHRARSIPTEDRIQLGEGDFG